MEYLEAILKDYLTILTESDKELIKHAAQLTYGYPIRGDVGNFDFLQGVEQSGTANMARTMQLVSEYIIYSHGAERISVTPWGFIENHPFQVFIRQFMPLIKLMPEVITHYIEVQGWTIDPLNMPNLAEYIPHTIERADNIE